MKVIDGKTVVFVGQGAESKWQCYQDVCSWGAETVVVKSHDEVSSSGNVVNISVANLYERVQDAHLVQEICDTLAEHDIRPDGVLTLWEDCVPLSARICEKIGLRSIDVNTADNVKSKYLWQQALNRCQDADIKRLCTRMARVHSLEELLIFAEQEKFDFLTKLEFGSSAAGVVNIRSEEAAIAVWNDIRATLKKEPDCPGIGLGFGNQILASERHSGSEHDVDIVMHSGHCIAAFLTDNGETRREVLSEKSAVMPTLLDTQNAELLRSSAVAICRTLGLSDGVFNLEFILTEDGPKVIDVNARMGGFYIREWIRTIWEYDILEAAVVSALGGLPVDAEAAKGYVAGLMVVPSLHGSWIERNRQAFSESTNQVPKGAIVTVFDRHTLPRQSVDEPWGNFACFASEPLECVSRLDLLWETVGLSEIDQDAIDQLKDLILREGKQQ